MHCDVRFPEVRMRGTTIDIKVSREGRKPDSVRLQLRVGRSRSIDRVCLCEA